MKLVPYLITLTLPFISLSARADYHPQINAGNTVSGDVVDGSKGNQHVYGTLTDSTITGPYAYSYVGDGGQTNHITVTDHGELFLEPGGSAYDTQITACGDLQVNGYAENTYVDSGDRFTLTLETMASKTQTKAARWLIPLAAWSLIDMASTQIRSLELAANWTPAGIMLMRPATPRFHEMPLYKTVG